MQCVQFETEKQKIRVLQIVLKEIKMLNQSECNLLPYFLIFHVYELRIQDFIRFSLKMSISPQIITGLRLLAFRELEDFNNTIIEN